MQEHPVRRGETPESVRNAWAEEWREKLLRWVCTRSSLLLALEEPADAVHAFFADKLESLAGAEYSDQQTYRAFHNHLISRLRHETVERRALEQVGWIKKARQQDSDRIQDAFPEIPHQLGLRMLRQLVQGENANIDWGAVLLLHERGRAAMRVAPLGCEEPPSIIAEHVYPWEPEDATRRPCAKLSSIGELWRSISAQLDDGVVHWSRLVGHMGIPVAVWHQWIRRGKSALVRQNGMSAVTDAFPHWRRGNVDS